MRERSAAKAFSRAACLYHERAAAHRAIAVNTAALLPESASSVLEAGCGTGFLTERLRQAYPQARVEAVDLSEAMVAEAGRRLGEVGFRWHVADVRHFRPQQPFDLIASSSALQWMTPLDATFRHFAQLLSPGGRLVASLMVAGTLGELRAAREAAVPGKPLRDQLISPGSVLADLEAAGFLLEAAHQNDEVIAYPSARCVLSEMRDLGFTGGSLSTAASRLSKSELRSLLAEYERKYGGERGVTATFRVLYLSAALR